MDTNPENLWLQIENELMNAYQARHAGNEGKARVCARRAVGQALQISGIKSKSSLTAIQELINNQAVPNEIRDLSTTLLEKVDGSHQLRPGIDLLDNAEKIITFIRTNGNFF